MNASDKLEWHDARVERVEVTSEGEARVVFSRFYFYEGSDSGPSTRVRSAELLLRDVDALHVTGRFAYEGFVSYATVETVSGERREAESVGTAGDIRRITIALTNGASIDVRCGYMKLDFTD